MTVTIRPYKKTASWEVDIRIEWPTGETHRERVKSPVTSKSGSQRWAEAKERELYANGPPKASNTVTFESFWTQFLSQHVAAERLSKASINVYTWAWEKQLKPVFGKMVLSRITQADVQAFKGKLSERYKPNTVNIALTLLGLLVSKAVEWNLLDKMPISIKLQTAGRSTGVYTTEDYERLITAAKELRDNPSPKDSIQRGTHLAMVLLGGDAGLRGGEICGLSWRQLDFTNNRITIDQAAYHQEIGDPKGTVGGLPMTSRLVAALKYLETEKTGEQVFANRYGKVPKLSSLKAWMERVEKQAGMPVTGRLHILRHTFGSLLAQRGVPPHVIKELMRHASLSMTERYTHVMPGALDLAIAVLGNGEPVETEKETEPKPEESFVEVE
jgi:integrase